MSAESPVKALLLAVTDDAPAAAYTINRLTPELLCFFVPEPAKALVESAVQPMIAKMPRRWDWLVTPDPARFMACYRTLARGLPEMLRAWEVHGGELVLDLTGATPAMAAAMALAGLPATSRVVMLGPAAADGPAAEGELVTIEDRPRCWAQGNPWDEAAAHAAREAAALFNRGSFEAAASLFRHVEARVSGGQKPLYRALADLAQGYGLWERFHYRQAWDKLKTSLKALDMALVWGGPPGLKAALPAVKQNAGFLEKLVLDPLEVKEAVAHDLLAHARRRMEVDQDAEAAMATLLRALEAFAQLQLFKRYKIKTWDVQPEQLPEALREPCRTSFLDDVDGKYKLPLQAQFRALAGLGDPMGQTYLAQWPKMKPLLDAAGHAVLGHGFEPVKPERFHQLHEIVLKLTGVGDSSLPQFPNLRL
jgi:CRISPR-associated protein (TIGR02710 family)